MMGMVISRKKKMMTILVGYNEEDNNNWVDVENMEEEMSSSAAFSFQLKLNEIFNDYKACFHLQDQVLYLLKRCLSSPNLFDKFQHSTIALKEIYGAVLLHDNTLATVPVCCH